VDEMKQIHLASHCQSEEFVQSVQDLPPLKEPKHGSYVIDWERRYCSLIRRTRAIVYLVSEDNDWYRNSQG